MIRKTKCFDIGGTVNAALYAFTSTDNPFSGPTGERSAGNGSIMRLAPVPMFYHREPSRAVRISGESSRTTHGTKMAVDSCRYLGGLLVGAINGATKEELLAPMFEPAEGTWESISLDSRVEQIARGGYKSKSPPRIKGTGFVVDSLEAALWAFFSTETFAGAVCGQIAGAYYGASAIPEQWVSKIAKREAIQDLTEGLFNGPR